MPDIDINERELTEHLKQSEAIIEILQKEDITGQTLQNKRQELQDTHAQALTYLRLLRDPKVKVELRKKYHQAIETSERQLSEELAKVLRNDYRPH